MHLQLQIHHPAQVPDDLIHAKRLHDAERIGHPKAPRADTVRGLRHPQQEGAIRARGIFGAHRHL